MRHALSQNGSEDYTHYNDRVNSATVERLLALNRRFYTERGIAFSETRLRVQPGVGRILGRLRGNEAVLDLGCGNGAMARELSRKEHTGAYTGLDSSETLVEVARAAEYALPVRFVVQDLTALAGWSFDPEGTGDAASATTPSAKWDVVAAFAVLHHIPSHGMRVDLLSKIRKHLKPDGVFVHSNWQFAEKARREGRLRPWFDAGFEDSELERGDYLMDWRRGGTGLRYVHEFSETELDSLAAETGFAVTETFRSDGADAKSGLYGIWRPS